MVYVDKIHVGSVGAIRNSFIIALSYLSVCISVLIKSKKHHFRILLQNTSSQIYFTGVQMIPTVSLIALTMGSVTLAQLKLSPIGTSPFLADLHQIIVAFIIRDLGPLLVTFVLIARSLTAIVTEIASMKINKDFDMLEVFGIHPVMYILLPRIFGFTMSLLGLSLMFAVVAQVGAVGVQSFLQDNFELNNLLMTGLTPLDLFHIFLKSGFIGAGVVITAYHIGYSVKSSTHEVPQAASRAISISLSLSLVLHGIYGVLTYVIF